MRDRLHQHVAQRGPHRWFVAQSPDFDRRHCLNAIPSRPSCATPNDRDERALTDPVLIVEILSPSNQAATWTNVWAYTTIPSVQEILVLRSDRIAASLLRRQPDTTWPDRPIDITEGPLTLDSITF
jgi:Uma2 family endonuclease